MFALYVVANCLKYALTVKVELNAHRQTERYGACTDQSVIISHTSATENWMGVHKNEIYFLIFYDKNILIYMG